MEKKEKGKKVKRNILFNVPEEHLEYGTGEVMFFQYCLNKCGRLIAAFINFRKLTVIIQPPTSEVFCFFFLEFVLGTNSQFYNYF